MSIHVNVGGQNKKTSSAWMKINGEWKKGTFWNNVNGEWKKHSGGNPFFVTMSNIVGLPTKVLKYTLTPKVSIISDVNVVGEIIPLSHQKVIYNPYKSTITIVDSYSIWEVDLNGIILRKVPTQSNNYKIHAHLDESTILAGSASSLSLVDCTTGAVLKSATTVASRETIQNILVDKAQGKIHQIAVYSRNYEEGIAIGTSWDCFNMQLNRVGSRITIKGIEMDADSTTAISMINNKCVFCYRQPYSTTIVNCLEDTGLSLWRMTFPVIYGSLDMLCTPSGHIIISNYTMVNSTVTFTFKKYDITGRLLQTTVQDLGVKTPPYFKLEMIDENLCIVRTTDAMTGGALDYNGSFIILDTTTLSIVSSNTTPFWNNEPGTSRGITAQCNGYGDRFANPETFNRR